LVFDLGAGTFDVSLLEVGEGVVEVKATGGDDHLGGDDWTDRIVSHLVEGFESRYGIDLSRDRVAMRRIRDAAEMAKIDLSATEEAWVQLPHIAVGPSGPLHLDRHLSRREFQRMTSDLLDRCKVPFNQVLEDAEVKLAEINHVVLVGGATRMPAVVSMVSELSGGQEPNRNVNPDEVVAVGACLQAGVLTGQVKDVLLLDVAPLSLGVETKRGVFIKIIEHNATIPTKRSEIFTTAEDNQSHAQIRLFQGENEFVAYNKQLGALNVDGIPSAPRGVPLIEVAFDIDANGVINVNAKDLGSGAEATIQVTRRSAIESASSATQGGCPLMPISLCSTIVATRAHHSKEPVDPVDSGWYRPRGRARADSETNLTISAAEARLGTTIPLMLSVKVQCEVCFDTSLRETCDECGGVGGKQTEREVTVRIPPGTRDDQYLRYRELGAQSDPYRPASDLTLRLTVPDDTSMPEAKVLLVGEGTVGKTSLIAALRGDPFEERSRTHGIEVHSVVLRDPESQVAVTMRFWDFGGQQVYRATHQFFFSPHALYLVVWNARAGQDKDDVAGWLTRIRLRLGDAAKVLLIATHCDEGEPQLDYALLQQAFPGMLFGHYDVDNKSGTGIGDLRKAIVRHAAAQHLAEMLSENAIIARDEILARASAQPCVSYQEFSAVCAAHGMSELEAESLARLLHQLGQIIYQGDDDALRDLVILDPEWLSKATGYVLEDELTRISGGILDHSRLAEIWRTRADRTGYARHHYPYFLRLMEKFDISYRLEDGRHSLIAQLVPVERPALPWYWNTPVADGLHRLTLTCRLTGAVPGLVAALTVRLNYADTGLRWRDGLFLRHPNSAYASEALVELFHNTELRIEVRAPSPDLFLHVLSDSAEYLTRRWPGLNYEHFIPCPAYTSADCTGQFRLEKLLKAQQHGIAKVTCQECFTEYQIAELLTGFPQMFKLATATDLDILNAHLRDLAAGIGRIDRGVLNLQADAAKNAHAMRRLLALAGTEILDCPRLFTLTSVHPAGWERVRADRRHFHLTLWCEHSGYWHPCPDGVYTLDRPKEWLQQISRYARPMFMVLRHAVPLAGAFAGVMLSQDQLDSAKHELDLMEALMDELPIPNNDAQSLSSATTGTQPTAAEGAELRGVRQLLHEIDPYQRFGGLRRVQATSGEYLWVCIDHFSEYDPGLPSIE